MDLTVDRPPIDLSAFPANLQKHLQPDAPEKLKLMAARGMLPIPPEQNIRVLYQLHKDSSDSVREAAGNSLADLPSNLLVPALEKEDHPGVLDWVVTRRADDAEVVETVVRVRATSENTIARLARRADAKACEIIATNQVRVLEAPVILEQLYQNPNARMATVDRLLELARREKIELTGLPALRDVLQGPRNIFEEDESTQEEGDAFGALLQKESRKAEEEEKNLEKLEEMTRSEREDFLEDDEEEEERSGSLHSQIAHMSISKKIRMATIGSRAAINILVHDANKLVHMAAIRSPRIRYPDIKKWSNDKSLPDNVVSFIASNRDWTRHYEVMLNLVNNPKTPLSDAMTFLNRIRTSDLKSVSMNRNVPNQVSRQAKKLWQKRSSGRR